MQTTFQNTINNINTLKKKATGILPDFLFSHKTNKIGTGVEIKVVNEPIFFGSIPTYSGDVLCIYDANNPDSLFGFSWFSNIYSEQIKAFNWETDNVSAQKAQVIFIVGVELSKEELIDLSNSYPNCDIQIFGYKDSYGYLYSKNKELNNITLYRADDNYNIGGNSDISSFENSVASMIKISYFYTYAWRNWGLSSFATHVAHYASFFANVPEYGLTKSIFSEEVIYTNKTQVIKKNVINFSREAAIFNFKNLAHSALIGNNLDALAKTQVSSNLMDYSLFKDRLHKQIDKSAKVYALRDKSFIDAMVLNALFVPCTACDFIEVLMYASRNYSTVVGVEDSADFKTYFVYSTIKGHAKVFAELLKGDDMRSTLNGVVVVKKAKHHNGEYNY